MDLTPSMTVSLALAKRDSPKLIQSVLLFLPLSLSLTVQPTLSSTVFHATVTKDTFSLKETDALNVQPAPDGTDLDVLPQDHLLQAQAQVHLQDHLLQAQDKLHLYLYQFNDLNAQLAILSTAFLTSANLQLPHAAKTQDGKEVSVNAAKTST